MKVTISALGRAHMFNLARQVMRHGDLERIYSGFNWGSLKRENIPRAKVTTLPVVRPFMMLKYPALLRPAPSVMQQVHRASAVFQDAIVSRSMPDADLFVAQECLGLWSGPAAQQRGAKFVLDRGCTHMHWRHLLLEEEYERVGLERHYQIPTTHDRELAEYDLADMIVVPSQFAKKSFIASGIPAERVVVVPYGVELKSFAPDSKPPSDIFEVVFVGHLSVRKGAFDIFAALDLLASRNVRLTLVGSMEPAVEKRLRQQLGADNVRVMGRLEHDRLRHVLSRSHVLVLPSIEDGFGLVVPEAMACGCPVIVTENAGALEHVTHGVEGFVVPIRRPDAIAAAIELMIDDPQAREAMGQNAIARTRSLGGWDKYGDEMHRAYALLLEGRPFD